jgi:hypothetical protein
VQVPPLGTAIEGVEADVLVVGTQLMYHSTTVSPLNAAEFIKAGAVVKLCEVVAYALSIVSNVSVHTGANTGSAGVGAGMESGAGASVSTGAHNTGAQLLVYAMKTLSSVAAMDSGRRAMLLCPFAEKLYAVLALDKVLNSSTYPYNTHITHPHTPIIQI